MRFWAFGYKRQVDGIDLTLWFLIYMPFDPCLTNPVFIWKAISVGALP